MHERIDISLPKNRLGGQVKQRASGEPDMCRDPGLCLHVAVHRRPCLRFGRSLSGLSDQHPGSDSRGPVCPTPLLQWQAGSTAGDASSMALCYGTVLAKPDQGNAQVLWRESPLPPTFEALYPEPSKHWKEGGMTTRVSQGKEI